MSYRPFRKLYKPSVWQDKTLGRVVWKVSAEHAPILMSLFSVLEWEPEGSEAWETAKDQLLSIPGFPHKEIGFPNVDPNLHLVIEIIEPVKSLPGVNPPGNPATFNFGDDRHE